MDTRRMNDLRQLQQAANQLPSGDEVKTASQDELQRVLDVAWYALQFLDDVAMEGDSQLSRQAAAMLNRVKGSIFLQGHDR